MILARSSSVKQSSSKSLALVFTPRSSTPWLRTSRKPSSKILFAAFATSGVIWRALFTCVCSAKSTSRSRAFFARRSNPFRSEEHTSELQSQSNLVCRLLLEKKIHLVHAQQHRKLTGMLQLLTEQQAPELGHRLDAQTPWHDRGLQIMNLEEDII